MRILFARVGYMKFYQGPIPGDDKPIGGGSYNTNEIGHEVYNFLNINETMYGYFQPHMKSPCVINLERIQDGCVDDKIDDVLVIWFATNPIDKGQVVIGWYKNATVFKAIQSPSNLPDRDNFNYNIKARAEDCVLLPINKRKFPVGHNIDGVKKGNPGQANVFYVLDSQGKLKDMSDPVNAWIEKAIEYVTSYKGKKIESREDEIQEDIKNSEYSSGGQGFQSDVEVRLKVEAHAMAICKKHYSSLGYEVEDVSASHSYDFIIKKDDQIQFIEVKGTQSSGDKIILTKNEVELCRNDDSKMILFLVHSILMNKKNVRSGSGVFSIIDPWEICNERLTPISFTYRLK